MAAAKHIDFRRFHLQRPLAAKQVQQLLVALSAQRPAPPIVLETWSTSDEVVQLIGAPAGQFETLARLVEDLLPGSSILGSVAESARQIETVGRLRQRPRDLSLTVDNAELTATAILSALANQAHRGERVVLQIILGPRVSPRLTRRPVAYEARDVSRSISARRADFGFECAIRLGASSQSTRRSGQLLLGLTSAMATATGPGVRLDLVHDAATKLTSVRTPWRWPIQLSTSELVGWLGWPLGDRDLPGIAPLHPKVLPVQSASRVRAFAIGTAPTTRQPVGISASDALLHTVLLGPTGSGKSSAMLHLIEADVKAGLPVVVLDPKRDLVDDVLGRIPAHRVEDVVVLDLADSQPIGLNPLDAAGRRPEVVADGIVAALRAVFADGWGPRTEDLFYCSILSLTIAGQRRSRPYTLVDIPPLLTDPVFRRTVVGSVGNDAMLASFWGSYESLGEAAQAQVLAAPMNKLRQYLRSQLRHVLGQASSPFRMSEMFVTRQILLVPLNEGLVGPISAALLGSLLVAELWQSILARANEHRPVDRPAMVYIDEAHRFMHLPTSLEDALSRSRSLGVGWHLAHQSRSQLPTALREAIDANARNKIVFGLSSHDANQMAKQAEGLEAEDFMSLGQFQAYVRPVVSGHPAAWCSVKTLSPSDTFSSPRAIRAASALKFRTYIEGEASAAQISESPEAAPVGRKRRTS